MTFKQTAGTTITDGHSITTISVGDVLAVDESVVRWIDPSDEKSAWVYLR